LQEAYYFIQHLTDGVIMSQHSQTEAIVSSYRASGLSQRDFCDTASITYPRLQYHLKKHRRCQVLTQAASSEGRFIAIKPTDIKGEEGDVSVLIIRGIMSTSRISEIVKSALRP
jgi:hypothetical protein